ncbi:hypothetical protein V6N13_057831 [Hibiscus sabdariffa]
MGEGPVVLILFVPFGPEEKYIPKELLWPHIPEFVDSALSHIRQISKVLGEQIGGAQPVWHVAIHGHYADAGDSAAHLSGALNVPMLFTGHSLGSTTQEIEDQWRLYDGFYPVLECKLRARIKRGVNCHGRFMPRMVVIHMDGDMERNEENPTPDPPICSIYPKHQEQYEVPDIYGLAAKTKGVFINPAFIEPFGLTLIEAATYGLPIVATKNGGPVDILKVLDDGVLAYPDDQQSIADALLKLVSDK